MNWYKLTKFAGTIEPPPKMVEEIVSIAKKYFAQQNNKPTSMLLPINLDGWKYGNENLKEKAKYWAIQNSKEMFEDYKDFPGLVKQIGDLETLTNKSLRLMSNIHLNLSKTCPRSQISWQPAFFALNICILPKDIRILNELEIVVKHELSHFAQSYLTYTINGKSLPTQIITGLPPRKIKTPQYDQTKSTDSVSYHLDDLEFHTLLQDIITSMKNYLSRFLNPDKNFKLKTIKYYLDSSQFIKDIKYLRFL